MSYDYDRKTAARPVTAGESFSDWYENISFKASQKVKDLDETFIGTTDYMGIAYFWNMEYKFELRDASPAVRRKVHATFLRAGLDLDGVSPKHASIVKKLAG